MLHDALDITDGPVAIRYPRTPAVIVGEDEVGSGLKARQVRSGDDVCILAVGKMLEYARGAAETLADEGISCSVWDVRVVTPLDPLMLADAVRHRAVITVEDGIRAGGVGSAIRDHILDHGDANPTVRVLGVPVDYIAHGSADTILASLGLDSDGIAEAVRSLP